MKTLFTSWFQRLLPVVLLLLARPAVQAQAPAWYTALSVSPGCGCLSGVNATATDSHGDVYVLGYFAGTIMLGNTTLVAGGTADLFIAKFSPRADQYVWAYRAGSSQLTSPVGLAVQGSSVYLAGTFEAATATFGGITITNSGSGTLNAEGFVAKLTDAGSSARFVWATAVGTASYGRPLSLAASATGVYLGGTFSGTMRLGSTTLTSAAGGDGFVAKLTDTGPAPAWAWAWQANSTGGNMTVTALATAGSNLYLAGAYEGAAHFGAVDLLSSGNTDAFVAKFSDNGTTFSPVWAESAGGSNYEGVNALVVAGANVYLGGLFDGTIFGFNAVPAPAYFGSLVLHAVGGNDGFVAKLSDQGSTARFGWVQRLGGPRLDAVQALAVRGSGVYATGTFNTVSFQQVPAPGAADFGSTILQGGGDSDLFVTRLSDSGPAGTFDWALAAGGSRYDLVQTIALSEGQLLVGGYFTSPTADFGQLFLSAAGQSSTGFLAAVTDATLLATRPGSAAAGLAVVPNPSTATSATVWLPPAATAEPRQLTVLDALGRRVRSLAVPAPAPHYPLDLTGLAPGLYLLRLSSGNTRLTHRLVVE